MSSLIDTVSQQLSGDTLSQMSQRIGADPGAVQNAVSVALPMLLGGLAQNASHPQGAHALDQALEQDHDGSVLDDVQSVVSNPTAFSGSGILGHIFGGRQAPVTEGVSRASGLNQQQVMQLLIMLAPLIMGALGRMKRQQGVSTGGLGGILQQQRTQAEERAPGIRDILGAVLGGSQGGGTLGGLFGR